MSKREQLKYEFHEKSEPVQSIQSEEQMRLFLAMLKMKFEHFEKFTVLGPRGCRIENFQWFLSSILAADSWKDDHEPFDKMVNFTIDGDGKIGCEQIVGGCKYSFLQPFKLMIGYRILTEQRECNCENLNQDTCACIKNGDVLPDELVQAITDCPDFKYSMESGVKGINGNPPKTLNELLQELYGFKLALPAWKLRNVATTEV